MTTETRPVPCGNPRVMANVAYHQHELRCASCLQVLLDAANLQIEAMRKVVEIAKKIATSEDGHDYIVSLIQAVEEMGTPDKPKGECAIWCDDPEHQKKHDFSKWPEPRTCELCRLRIVGHQHVAVEKRKDDA